MSLVCSGRRLSASVLVRDLPPYFKCLYRQNNSFADRCSLKRVSSSSRTAFLSVKLCLHCGFARVIVSHGGGVAPCLPRSILKSYGCLARFKMWT